MILSRARFKGRIIELTGRSAYHRPASVFPGQHIVNRLRYRCVLISLSRGDRPIPVHPHSNHAIIQCQPAQDLCGRTGPRLFVTRFGPATPTRFSSVVPSDPMIHLSIAAKVATGFELGTLLN
jgi:hypothetical protein